MLETASRPGPRPAALAAPLPGPRRAVRAALPALLALAMAACSSAATPAPSVGSTAASASATGTTTPVPSATPVRLTVYGAASLKAVLDTIKVVYEASIPGSTISISTDSSAALETKIEQGAPADVFLSADTINPQRLVDNGFAAGTATAFATNRLAIVVPTTNSAGITSPADLAGPGVRIIACGDAVPITRYATQLIANLAKQASYPGDYVARYAANIVSKEPNVSAVVAKVELGEGDAGVVYATDARASPRLTPVTVPDWANVPASYGGVVVKASRSIAAAQAFLAWLKGADGQPVLASFGFLPPA